MKPLDQADRKILKLLQEDAKYTTKEIAARIGMTTTPVFERIKRMEREGLIKNYMALVDRKKAGLNSMVFCSVSLKQHDAKMLVEFENDIQNLPEVMECYHIAGMFDYLLKVVVPDMDTYQYFVAKKLAALNNIGTVQSSFVMNEVKHSRVFNLDNKPTD